MNQLATLLHEDQVLIDCHIKSKKRALELLSKLITEELEGEDLDFQDVLTAFIEREKLGSTTLGHGVALPHARFTQLSQPYAAVIRLYNPINYDDQDDPVQLLVGLIMPDNESLQEQNLLSLKAIVEQLRDPEKLKQLMSLESHAEVFKLLTQ